MLQMHSACVRFRRQHCDPESRTPAFATDTRPQIIRQDHLQSPHMSADLFPSGIRTLWSVSSKLAGFSHRGLRSMHQRHLNEVFGQKPGLQFIGAQNIAHNHIVRAVIAKCGCTTG